MCTIDSNAYVVKSSAVEINRGVDAVKNLLLLRPPEDRFLSLDAEWDVDKNAQGFITGVGKIALIQVFPPGQPHTHTRTIPINVYLFAVYVTVNQNYTC